MPDADVAVVCVGTPSRKDGLLEMGHVVAVAEELGAAIRHRPDEAAPLRCVFRSTMLPGTMETLVIPTITAAAGAPPGGRYEVAFNPEFSRSRWRSPTTSGRRGSSSGNARPA